jgi:hypothetical protein
MPSATLAPPRLAVACSALLLAAGLAGCYDVGYGGYSSGYAYDSGYYQPYSYGPSYGLGFGYFDNGDSYYRHRHYDYDRPYGYAPRPGPAPGPVPGTPGPARQPPRWQPSPNNFAGSGPAQRPGNPSGVTPPTCRVGCGTGRQ